MTLSGQLIATATLMLLCSLAQTQIKTSGIKSRQPPAGLGNLQISSNIIGQSEYTERNYSSYVPTETYGGRNLIAGHYVQQILPTTGVPQILDETALFINKTRSTMASGICYKEVPTASLVHSSRDHFVGNATTHNMSRIQVCCEGYDRNPHIYRRCEPICDDDCPNGICTEPNTCVCIPGHVRTTDGKCISTCPLGCGNGICDEQNQCRCREGYTLDTLSGKYCQPECTQSCANGRCVSPNTCECLTGYRRVADGSCAPVCDQCENGTCMAPGHCTCKEGYQSIEARCEPICEEACKNGGHCIAPNTCECAPGYNWNQKTLTCDPHCDVPCLNGKCVGQNVCECNPGYVTDEHQRNICQPHCPQGCPNGYCSGPNFCICRPGFIKSGIKGRQNCQPV